MKIDLTAAKLVDVTVGQDDGGDTVITATYHLFPDENQAFQYLPLPE